MLENVLVTFISSLAMAGNLPLLGSMMGAEQMS